MNNRYKRLFEDDEKSGDFWPTFTDMLATILLVVLLIQVGVIMDAQAEKEKNMHLEQQLSQINGTRTDIANRLITVFKEHNIDVKVDEKTGDIQFSNEILFESDKAVFTKAFKNELNKIMPLYFRELMPFIESGEISEIIIEGHTDDVLDYDYNLALSQERALNVSKYIANNIIAKDKIDTFRGLVTANGRSYSELIYTEDNKVDRAQSRRVEIKYRIANSLINNDDVRQ